MVVLGGDVTGKVMVPITSHNGYWEVVFGSETRRIESKEELERIETQIRNRGSYPAVMSPDELSHLSKERGPAAQRFAPEMLSSLDGWPARPDGRPKAGQIPYD